MSHAQVQELLGALALDAVDPLEAATVSAHLVECPRCREEVAQHQQMAAMLANGGGKAPPGIWDAIASRIERPATPGKAFPLPGIAGSDELEPGRRIRRGVRVRAVGLAAAAAAVIAVTGFQVDHLDHRVNQLAVHTSAQILTGAARNALLDPMASRVVLTSTTGAARPVAEVVAELSGAAYLFNTQLPPLAPARTYQLWAMIDGQAISVGLLGPRPATVAFTLNPAGSTDAYAITVEPAGGSIAPTQPPVASTTA